MLRKLRGLASTSPLVGPMQDAYVLMEFESPYPCTRAVFVTGSKVCVAGYQDGTLRAFDLDKVLLLEKSPHSKALLIELKTLKDQLVGDFEQDLLNLADRGRVPGSKTDATQIVKFTRLAQDPCRKP